MERRPAMKKISTVVKNGKKIFKEPKLTIGLDLGDRRNSGMSERQMHISKEGDRYLRTLLVQGAHYILGPFGQG
jgi:hypothetical protein